MAASDPRLETVVIRRANETDLPTIRELACRIWRAYYPAIISHDQIEYMLAQRYTETALLASVRSGTLTFEILTVNGTPTGFAGHGPAAETGEYQLHQVYVLPECHGLGLGGRLIRYVEVLARATGRSTLVLTVNRRNARALAAYARAGFQVRHAADFPIGNGFLMEDYVLEKPLEQPQP